MLAYAHINLLSTLSRFTPDEEVRVATDSIYVRKSTLKRLEGVEAFIPMKKCDCRCSGGTMCVSCLLGEEHLHAVAPARWRDKDEELYMPVEQAAYLAKPYYKTSKKNLSQHRAAPRRPAVEVPLELPKRRRGQRQKPFERSSSSAREIPSSSARHIAWPKRCGPGASRPRPTTASSDGVARRSGRLKGWGRSSFLVY